ncbi:Hypothetical predicted protein, partial [Olea europaea subsp. europaea]
MMEFKFRIPESARLRAHILQRSNLKYVKTVMDQFDEQHREDFRNSSLRYLADVPDIQFSGQLIQQLVFRTIRIDKLYELWFSMQGHLMRFGLQERLLHGFRGTWAKKFQKAKRMKEKEITYTVHDFPIAMQVWAYEALPEVGERFAERLHVYATLRPTDAEEQQPYFSTLMPYDEPPVPILDDIARTVVAPQFNASGGDGRDGGYAARKDSEEEASEGGRSEEQTSGGDEEKGVSGSDLDVKPKIQQHVTSECTSLREFLATLVARAGPTTAEPATRAETEADVSGSLPEDIYGGPAEPCPYESDISIDTGNMQ